jgi:thiosulfate reductase cytochrome b subunit
MKPITILKEVLCAMVLAGVMLLINCVEPLPVALSNIFAGTLSAKTALVILSSGYVIYLLAALLMKRTGGWHYGIRSMLRRYR